MTVDLLLLSSSRVHGGGYLEHARPAIRDFLGEVATLYFVPYALADHDGYTARAREAFAPLGVDVRGVHEGGDPCAAVEGAAVLFVGGGNSFRLLAALQRHGLVEPIRRRAAAGELRYLGSSAGTNMACPSIRTTNDMPIVQPQSLEALGLLPFQINPHYVDPDPGATHMGETREQRLLEFLEENDGPVLGMHEGAWLRRRGPSLWLEGRAGARLFRRGEAPRDLAPGTDLAWLLDVPTRFDVGR